MSDDEKPARDYESDIYVRDAEIARLRAELAAEREARDRFIRHSEAMATKWKMSEARVVKLREALEDADNIREAMKAAARELPYMSNDVEFFGVCDDEWTAIIRATFRAVLEETSDE